MDFKTCEFYNKSVEQEHCPFDCVCSLSCYFTNRKIEEDFNRLRRDYDTLLDEVQDYNSDKEELKELEYERDNLEVEKGVLSRDKEHLIAFIISALRKVNRLIDLDKIFKDLEDFDINLDDQLRIKETVMEDLDLDEYRVEVTPSVKVLDIVCSDKKYLPAYANDTDACMDLKIKLDDSTLVLDAGTSVVLSTGIKVKIPDGYFMQIFPRSSTGFKLNCMLANTVGIIDTGFRDEIKLKIHNFGNEPVTLEDGQRIAQFVLLPRPKLKLNVVEDNEEFRTGDRGGGFGSSGK